MCRWLGVKLKMDKNWQQDETIFFLNKKSKSQKLDRGYISILPYSDALANSLFSSGFR